MTLRALIQSLRRRLRTAPGKRPAPYTEAELLARADEFNRNAETYWREVALEPSGRRHALNKPFSALQVGPEVVYRLGLMLAELRLGVGLTVLDFGAGSCWLSSCLNRLGCHTIAVDVSVAALELGRELFHSDARHRTELEPEFLPYDGHRIPVPDESVDRIACFDAFHHVPNQDEVLREMYRVLRPGGRAVLAEPGEGHTHSDAAAFDEERYGVLENELDLLDLEGRAHRVGFTDVRVKPYPPAALLSLSPREYVGFIDGDTTAFPLRALRQSLLGHFTIILAKGDHVPDSRCPGQLRAQMQLLEPRGPLRVIGGGTLPLLVEIHNQGDTLWRHAADSLAGRVFLASHLLDDQKRVGRVDFYRAPLPEDVPPGATTRVLVQMPLPAAGGRYVLRLDLVDDEVSWFSQAGSPTLDVPIQVDLNAHPLHLSASLDCLGGNGPVRVHAGGRVSLPLRVTNLGPCSWPHSPSPGPRAIRLGGHVLDVGGRTIEADPLRHDLPRDVGVNESVEIEFSLRAPEAQGEYVLQLDMLQEQVCWFAQLGSTPLNLPLTVTADVADSLNPGILRARLEVLEPRGPLCTQTGARANVRIRATNAGNTRWLHTRTEGGGYVALGGRLRPKGHSVAEDYFRGPLPHDVNPGDSVVIAAELDMPSSPGRYRLELDLVDEGIAWFVSQGSQVVHVDLHVD